MADNSFENTDLVTKFGIKELMNVLMLAEKVDRQFDSTTIFDGDKVGESAKVRRAIYYKSTDGAVIEAGETSSIEEGTVDVVLEFRKKVVMAISSKEMALNVVDLQESKIRPAMVTLAQDVESAIAAVYKEIYNFTGTPGTTPSTFLEVGEAGRVLDDLGVPMDSRSAFYDPAASLSLANGLKGAFPQAIATRAIEKALIGMYAGFDMFKNQSLARHTVGINTGTPLVNGASQGTTYALSKNSWTQTLATDGWTNSQTGILKEGDVFTIANVFAVNRRTLESTGELAQFVVRADADSGASTGPAVLTISPPIITEGPYQTVDAEPANDAVITVKTGTGGTSYRQNLAFHKNAITLAFGQLDVPKDGVSSSRVNFKGISMRATRQYNITLDKTVFRFDIYFGVKAQNPDFAVRTTG